MPSFSQIPITKSSGGGVHAQAEIKLNLRPTDAIVLDVLTSVIGGIEKFAKVIVADAAKIARAKGVFDTGKLIGSIGYAVSPVGSGQFETLKTREQGETSSGAVKANPKNAETIIATSSGYGGWQEVGTRAFAPRPFITPAVHNNTPVLAVLLKGIIGEFKK